MVKGYKVSFRLEQAFEVYCTTIAVKSKIEISYNRPRKEIMGRYVAY